MDTPLYTVGQLLMWSDNQIEVVGKVSDVGHVPSTGKVMYRLTTSDGYVYAARFDEEALTPV